MDEEGYSTWQVRSRAVGAVLRGRSMVDVADAYDTDRSTVFRWVRRYQQEGDDGLRRRPAASKLNVARLPSGSTWAIAWLAAS